MSQHVEGSLRALAETKLKEAQGLEVQLRHQLRAKGFADASAVSLSNALRDKLEAVLLADDDFAESHDIEQAIWRGVYRRIEDFRGRLRKLSSAPQAPLPPPGSKPGARPGSKESIQNLLVSFRSYLAEATGFYHDLMRKLQAKYRPSVFGVNGTGASSQPCLLSCHRCLIYLGDLARYKEVHSDAKQKDKDWSSPASYYLQAAALYPASGNPHNQLAVLATYVEDELLAVYRYFRGLACDTPFLTARDNLILLFEKNRKRYSEAVATRKAGGAAALAPAGQGTLAVNKEDKILSTGDSVVKLVVKQKGSGDEGSLAGMRYFFRTGLVRFCGIIFTKTSLETFDEVFGATMEELEQLLGADTQLVEGAAMLDQRGSVGAVAVSIQVAVLCMYSVHNCGWAPEGHQPSYAEILQKDSLTRQAYTAAFECAAKILRRCAQAGDPLQCGLLPPSLLLLEWLAAQPDAAVGNAEKGDAQAKARGLFWQEAAGLLNRLLAELPPTSSKSPLSTPLWEDYELRGFQPLARSHADLDFTLAEPRPGLGSSEQQRTRAERAVRAGKSLALRLTNAAAEGLRWVEDRGHFFASERAVLLLTPPLLPPAPSVEKPSVHELLEKASLEEDEEEVIVFKPSGVPIHAVARVSTPPKAVIPPPGKEDKDAEDLLREAATPRHGAMDWGGLNSGPWGGDKAAEGKVLEPWKLPAELAADEVANSALFGELEPTPPLPLSPGLGGGDAPLYKTFLQNEAPAKSVGGGEPSLGAWNATSPQQPALPSFDEYQRQFSLMRQAMLGARPTPWGGGSTSTGETSLFANQGGAGPFPAAAPPPGVIGERKAVPTPTWGAAPAPPRNVSPPEWKQGAVTVTFPAPMKPVPLPAAPPLLDGGVAIPNAEEYAASPAFATALRELMDHKDEYAERGDGSRVGNGWGPRPQEEQQLFGPHLGTNPALAQFGGDMRSWMDSVTHVPPQQYPPDNILGGGVVPGFLKERANTWRGGPAPPGFPFPGTVAGGVQGQQFESGGGGQQQRGELGPQGPFRTSNPFVS